MAKKTVTMAEVKEALRPPERLLALQAERDSISAAFKEYKREHGHIEDMLAEVLAAIPSIDPAPVVYQPTKIKKVEHDVTVALHITDAHHGAIQNSDEIEGYGSFSPEISRQRQMGFVQDVLAWTDLHRSVYNIPEARFLVTGDLISGDIHDELRVTNAFPAPVQAVQAGEILAKQVAMAAPYFKRVVVEIITDDNHGRMTRKPQAKQAGLNNWMYVTANIAAVMLGDFQNVDVHIYPMPEKVVDVNGRRYLLCHGHDVSGWAGFPYYGIERKTAREALKRMNGPDATRFDRVIMGHWHAPMLHPVFWIGGSVSGTDTYDHRNGRHAKPQQTSWLVHPIWGEFDYTAWYLNKYD